MSAGTNWLRRVDAAIDATLHPDTADAFVITAQDRDRLLAILIPLRFNDRQVTGVLRDVLGWTEGGDR